MNLSDLDRFVVGDDDFQDWQTSLIYEGDKKNPDHEVQQRAEKNQKELNDAVTQGPRSTYQYMLRSFSKITPNRDAHARQFIPSFPNGGLTIDEMSKLTAHAEREIEKAFTQRGLSPAVAALSRFWALSHAFWIAEGIFGSDIARVFCEGPRADDSEARTRNFLRRTGGLAGVRGKTSVLTDCPLSAAWWRCRMANQIAQIFEREGASLGFEEAHEALRLSQVWTGIVDYAVKRVTVVNAPRARASVVAAVALHQAETMGKVTTAQVRSAVRRLAQLGHRYNLHHMEWDGLLAEAQYGLENPLVGKGIAETAEEEQEDS